MIPIRCFTCNKIIGGKWEEYKSHLETGMTEEIALNTVGLVRYCCRRHFFGHVEIIDQLLLFPNAQDRSCDEKSQKISMKKNFS